MGTEKKADDASSSAGAAGNSSTVSVGYFRRRVLVKGSKLLAKETRRLLRRHGARLKDSARAEITQALGTLEEANKAKDLQQVYDRTRGLDALISKHLGFARKSAARREFAESMAIAIVFALLLRAFVVEAFKIPSGSMLPTLEIGDHIFVNKFIYGSHVPMTRIKYFSSQPRRGEVIVFIYPDDETKDFIKRTIALAGDSVEVRDGVIYLNDKAIERRPDPGPCEFMDKEEGSGRWTRGRCSAFIETLDGTSYRVIHDLDAPATRDFAKVVVPPGHVFVMGDNRYNSKDSRFFGPVPQDNIKGKAMVIWWSPGGEGQGIRWRRIFHLLHAPPDHSKTEKMSSPEPD